METFGEFLKNKRISLGKTLRQFCDENDLDPGNISKIERGKMPPPTAEDKLRKYAQFLNIGVGTPEWETMRDLASISAGRIPEDMQDSETLARLPVLFRSIRSSKFTEDELNELVRKVRES